MSKPRSFKHVWQSAVMADKTLGYDVRGLLGSVAENIMQPDGMNVYAGQRYIAKACGSSQPTVSRLLAKAIKAGYLVKDDRPNKDGVVTSHLTPVIPKNDSDMNHSRSESESEGDSDMHQNPREDNPADLNQLASAEGGPRGPISSGPEQALVRIAMGADPATVDDVRRVWSGAISDKDAETISAALSRDSYFFGYPELCEITGIDNGPEFAFAVALAMDCAYARLEKPLTCKQVRMIADQIRWHLDLPRFQSVLSAPDGTQATFWRRPQGPVCDPVKFIVGSIVRAQEHEEEANIRG